MIIGMIHQKNNPVMGKIGVDRSEITEEENDLEN